MGWLDVLTPYDFVVRSALATALVAYGAYIMLRAGVFAVPQVGFMAIGSYISAILTTKYHLSFGFGLLAALIGTGAVGLVLGLALMRLDGIRLAIATIAFSEIVRIVMRNLDITGGATGIVGIPRRTEDWQLVAAIVVWVAVFAGLSRTKFGLAMDAMRGDALVASHQGINLRRYRIGVFLLAALVSATGGVLQVHMTGFIEPELFTFSLLTQVLAVAILGGMTAAAGPLLGSVVVFGAPEVLAPLANYRLVFNGVVIIAVMAIAPGGLAELVRWAWVRLLVPRSRKPPALVVAGPKEGAKRPIRSTAGEVLLSIESLDKRYGGLRAIDKLSLAVRRGELFGVIGPNGSGKTTLLNAISGVTTYDAGRISLDGVRLDRLGARPDRIARLGVSRTFQGIRLIRFMNVRQNVLLGAYCAQRENPPIALLGLGRTKADRRASQKVDFALARLGILADRESTIDKLPYGTQRRVEIARASVQEPVLLLLDEPTAGMTRRETSEIFDYLSGLCAEGWTVVVVEHDLKAMTDFCDRVAVLNHGALLAIGEPNEVMKSTEVIEAYVGRSHRG
jgi:branched-chain amino acid transport system permease protein